MKYNRNYPLEGFTFTKVSSGAYVVTYETDYDIQKGRYWKNRIEDMEIIYATRYADNPKRKDIELLRYLVKKGRMIKY